MGESDAHRSVGDGVGVKLGTFNGGGTNLLMDVEVGVVGWLLKAFVLFRHENNFTTYDFVPPCPYHILMKVE